MISQYGAGIDVVMRSRVLDHGALLLPGKTPDELISDAMNSDGGRDRDSGVGAV